MVVERRACVCVCTWQWSHGTSDVAAVAWHARMAVVTRRTHTHVACDCASEHLAVFASLRGVRALCVGVLVTGEPLVCTLCQPSHRVQMSCGERVAAARAAGGELTAPS